MTDSTPIRTALSEAYLGDTKNFHSMFSAPQTFDLRLQNILTGFAQQTDSATADDLAMPANLRAIAKALSDLTQSDRVALIQALKIARFHDSIAPQRGPFAINAKIINNVSLATIFESPHGSFTPVPLNSYVYLPTLGLSSLNLYCFSPEPINHVYAESSVVTQRSVFSLLSLPPYIGPASTYDEKMLVSQVYLDPRVGLINLSVKDNFTVASISGHSGSPRGIEIIEMVPAEYGDFDVLHEVKFDFENTSAGSETTKFRFHITPSIGPDIADITQAIGRTFAYNFVAAPGDLVTATFMLRIKRVGTVVTAGMARSY